jgi:beta-catenin-like protein 1
MSEVEKTIDRMLSGAASVPDDEFVAAPTWEGQKPGYYFSTGIQGTGYYKDKHQEQQQNSSKRKKVTIAEDNNEMKILLEELEKRAGNVSVVELTAKGIRAASKSLESIYKKNAMKREEFSDQPEQYMDSELALYEQLTGLQALAADTKLYQHVENSNLLGILSQLLGHDNIDVCAAVVSLFLEWMARNNIQSFSLSR